MTQDHETPPTLRQPWLHELAICVDGNTTALSAPDGQVEAAGAQGLFVDDRRVLSRLHVQVGDDSCPQKGQNWSSEIVEE